MSNVLAIHPGLLGMKARPAMAAFDQPDTPYFYTIVGVWLDDARLMCAVATSGGSTNVVEFVSLELAPSAVKSMTPTSDES